MPPFRNFLQCLFSCSFKVTGSKASSFSTNPLSSCVAKTRILKSLIYEKNERLIFPKKKYLDDFVSEIIFTKLFLIEGIW